MQPINRAYEALGKFFFSDKRVDRGDRGITVNLEMIKKYYAGIE